MRLLLIALTLGLLASARSIPADQAAEREKTLATDMEVIRLQAPIRVVGGPGAEPGWKVAPIGIKPSSGLALLIRVVNRTPLPFVVAVRPRSGGNERLYSSQDGRARADQFWTHEIPEYHAVVEIRPAPGDTGSPAVEVIAFGQKVIPATKERRCGDGDDVPAANAPPAARDWLKPVARLELFTSSTRAYCSAFLVGRDILMTNHHCALSDVVPGGIVARLGYDNKNDPEQDFAVVKRLGFDSLLDYALLRIEPAAPAAFNRLHLPPVPMPPPSAPGPLPAALLLVGHPDGNLKRVSIAHCRPEGPPGPNFFGHHCDTAGGSSGSPIMDAISGALVGLHEVGVVGCGSHGLANEAVRMERIVADLRNQRLSGTIDQAVVDEVLR